MSTNDFNAQVWSQFTQAISAKLGSGESVATIQILPSAMPLPGTGIASDVQTALAEFAEVIPQWGSAYNPSTASVESAYQIVLSQIQETATNGQAIQSQYDSAQKQLSDMMGQADQYKRSQIAGYLSAIAVYKEAGLPVPTFADWFKDNGQQAYDALLLQQAHQLQTVETLLSAGGIASPLVRALDDLNTVINANQGSAVFPLQINPDVSLITSWKTKPVNPGGVSLSYSSTAYDYSKSSWQAQSGYDVFGFISIGKRDASKASENILSSTSSYAIDIEFAAQAHLTAERNWINGALLRDYKNGPWIPDSSFATGKSHPYGDQTAVFPMIVTSIYVVMNSAVSITLDLASYQSVYQELNDNLNNGVNVGPFAFGGTGNSNDATICQVAAFKESRTFTLRDYSGIPQIIGLVCEIMP
jgi:hypothetical protein